MMATYVRPRDAMERPISRNERIRNYTATLPSQTPEAKATREEKERLKTVVSFFENADDRNRKRMLDQLMAHCKRPQWLHTLRLAENRAHLHLGADFTRILPRQISLHIFSFLDPRSLCKAAQVCWYWRIVADHNYTWRPICLRRGLHLNPSKGSSHECKILGNSWKVVYTKAAISVNAEYRKKNGSKVDAQTTASKTMLAHESVENDQSSDFKVSGVRKPPWRPSSPGVGAPESFKHSEYGNSKIAGTKSCIKKSAENSIPNDIMSPYIIQPTPIGGYQSPRKSKLHSVDADVLGNIIRGRTQETLKREAVAQPRRNCIFEFGEDTEVVTRTSDLKVATFNQRNTDIDEVEMCSAKHLADQRRRKDYIKSSTFKRKNYSAPDPGLFQPSPYQRAEDEKKRKAWGKGSSKVKKKANARSTKRKKGEFVDWDNYHLSEDDDDKKDDGQRKKKDKKRRKTSGSKKKGVGRRKGNSNDGTETIGSSESSCTDEDESYSDTASCSTEDSSSDLSSTAQGHINSTGDIELPEDVPDDSCPRVLLVSSKMQAPELLVHAALFDVLTIPYDYDSSNIDQLLHRIKRALRGRQARSLAWMSHGQPGIMRMVDGQSTTLKDLQEQKELRSFWVKLCKLVARGGRIDLLACSLAGSADGVELIEKLERLTQTNFAASDDVTGNESQGGNWMLETDGVEVARLYFNTKKLDHWTGTANMMTDALTSVRTQLAPIMGKQHKSMVDKMTAELVSDVMGASRCAYIHAITPLLQEALLALTKVHNIDPALFLSRYFRNPERARREQADMLAERNKIAEFKRTGVLPASGTKSASLPTQDPSDKSIYNVDVKNKRTFILREILDTETSYVNDLQMIKDIFIEPMRYHALKRGGSGVNAPAQPENRKSGEELNRQRSSWPRTFLVPGLMSKPMCTESDIRCVFSDLENVLNIGHKLLADLHGKLDNYSSDVTISDIFLRYLPSLRTYTSYVNNFDDGMRVLQKMEESSSSFRSFLKESRANPKCRMLGLPEHLIKPVQRIPRYALLLGDLCKNTPSTHPDYDGLVKVSKKIGQLCEFINESKRKAEQKQKVVELQEKIIKCPRIIEPHRHFVAFEDFVELARLESGVDMKDKSSKPIKHKATQKSCGDYVFMQDIGVFLFNDIVIFTCRVEERHGMDVHNHTFKDTYLSQCSLGDFVKVAKLKSGGPGLSNLFSLETVNKTWIFQAISEDERDEWTSLFMRYIKSHAASLVTIDQARLAKEKGELFKADAKGARHIVRIERAERRCINNTNGHEHKKNTNKSERTVVGGDDTKKKISTKVNANIDDANEEVTNKRGSPIQRKAWEDNNDATSTKENQRRNKQQQLKGKSILV